MKMPALSGVDTNKISVTTKVKVKLKEHRIISKRFFSLLIKF
jgi:hypothetical protein